MCTKAFHLHSVQMECLVGDPLMGKKEQGWFFMPTWQTPAQKQTNNWQQSQFQGN